MGKIKLRKKGIRISKERASELCECLGVGTGERGGGLKELSAGMPFNLDVVGSEVKPTSFISGVVEKVDIILKELEG